MRSPVLALLLAALSLSARAEEAPAKDFEAYQDQYENTCVGPAEGRQTEPTKFTMGGFSYELNGGKGRITRLSKRAVEGEIRLGVLSSIKDDEEETRQNIDEFLAKFKAADVDAILVGGDTAINESEIEPILNRVAGLDVPVLVVIGNAENKSSFNRATLASHRAHRNVINVDFVRSIELDGWNMVSLPGYYDKRYTHQSGPCIYKPEDTRKLKNIVAELKGPVVLLAHGPPKQAGKLAIDYVPDVGNVGDQDLSDVMAAAKIPFGIFGHILEAGAKATDPSGKKELKAGTWADALYLNPGSSNSLPWRLNTGEATYGTAAVLTLAGPKAKYEIHRAKQRIGK